MGESRDTDRGANGPWTGSFTLFERMMDEPRHLGRLFGDLSAMTQNARAGAPLRRVIERAGVSADGAGTAGEWAARLLNGSDYPLPGSMPLYSPRLLADTGLLDAADVAPLTALRGHNQLLFDFVLKRRLRSGGKRLAAPVFETRRFFETGKPA
jgi:mannonate dehydratase